MNVHKMPPWQPIETAPKDGTRIIVYRPVHTNGDYIPQVGCDYWMITTSFRLGGWAHSNDMTQPTHWMPMPLPPVPENKNEP